MSEGSETEGLIDVSNMDLARLLIEVDESALDRVVNCILASSKENVCHSFSSSV